MDTQPLCVEHVVHSLSPPSGGTSVSIPALCNAIASVGPRMALHVTDAGDAAPLSVGAPCRIVVHRCLPGTGGGTGRLGISPGLHLALSRAGRHADIVHSHGLWLWTNFDAYWATRGRKARVVLSPHGMLEPYGIARNRYVKSLMWKLGQGDAVRAAHCIHATAQSEFDSVRSLGLSNPIAIVPNGVALPELGVRKPDERKRLLYLGRVDHKKGIDMLLAAWATVGAEFLHWDLMIVGAATGDYDRQLRDLAVSVGAPRVTFVPGTYGAKRDELMAESDFFVMPTRSENFAMTVAEALACEVPVICSKGAPWQRLDAMGCGYWIDIGVEPLVGCLRKALQLSDDERRRMGRRGRAWMADEFGWDAQAKKMHAVYRWLSGRAERPSYVFD